ncbi:MAG: hypothetical protein WKG00_41135, partial [Polyangiaceae bacterium]
MARRGAAEHPQLAVLLRRERARVAQLEQRADGVGAAPRRVVQARELGLDPWILRAQLGGPHQGVDGLVGEAEVRAAEAEPGQRLEALLGRQLGGHGLLVGVHPFAAVTGLQVELPEPEPGATVQRMGLEVLAQHLECLGRTAQRRERPRHRHRPRRVGGHQLLRAPERCQRASVIAAGLQTLGPRTYQLVELPGHRRGRVGSCQRALQGADRLVLAAEGGLRAAQLPEALRVRRLQAD